MVSVGKLLSCPIFLSTFPMWMLKKESEGLFFAVHEAFEKLKEEKLTTICISSHISSGIGCRPEGSSAIVVKGKRRHKPSHM